MTSLYVSSNRNLAEKIAAAKEHFKHCNGTVAGRQCNECIAKRALLKAHKVK